MTEVLFMVTIIFVAYVVYTAVGSAANPGKSAPVPVRQPAEQETMTETAAAVSEIEAEAISEPAAAVVETAVEIQAVEAQKEPVAAEKTVNSLRDPKTGEVAAIPANYRFAKRWIKDALVAEGLLDKVYKNGELDAATSAKVKSALESLKAMEKYQV
jgi:hypothetical protein